MSRSALLLLSALTILAPCFAAATQGASAAPAPITISSTTGWDPIDPPARRSVHSIVHFWNMDELAQATCGTIRLKLLKLGARVTVSVRRIKIAIASAFPYHAEFALAHARLRAPPR
jgi:Transposase DDE domain group 1